MGAIEGLLGDSESGDVITRDVCNSIADSLRQLMPAIKQKYKADDRTAIVGCGIGAIYAGMAFVAAGCPLSSGNTESMQEAVLRVLGETMAQQEADNDPSGGDEG